MPILDFKPQFVPYILDGTKRHTIRATRKRPIKPGDLLFLYTGLRRDGSKLLMETSCASIDEISIFLANAFRGLPVVTVNTIPLSVQETAKLAWRDGFRPPSSTEDCPGNSFHLMMHFWDGRLPFHGQIIHWWYAPL